MLISSVVVVDGGVLGQDGDAALALEVVVVHRALGDPLVRAERAALVQQRVDQRGLAVVDVGDDGDVAAERIGYRWGVRQSGHPIEYTADRSTVGPEGSRARGLVDAV